MTHNFSAYNNETGRECGHMHHSVKSATACADHLGWTDFAVVKKLQRIGVKHTKVRECRDFRFDATYDVTYVVRIRADNEGEVYDRLEKVGHVLENMPYCMHADAVNVKRVVEE